MFFFHNRDETMISDVMNLALFLANLIGAVVYGLVLLGNEPTNRFFYEMSANAFLVIGVCAYLWTWLGPKQLEKEVVS